MTKDSLFKLIREEQVVLWAGAGLSLYAGYPSGNELKTILYDSLSPAEQALVDRSLNLTDFSEEFFRLKGGNKNSLIRALQKCIQDHKPSSTRIHDIIAGIPHFHTIVTTNFDRLFELAYGTEAQLILKNTDVSYINENKVQVIKIHGDFSEPDSILITKSDFTNFFKYAESDNLIWTVVKERIATKSICFIGYNLEDPSVNSVFEKIIEALGEHIRECYFVAPRQPYHKTQHLARKGIHYIDIDGETFFDQLLAEIKEHISSDFDKNLVSPDTLRRFLKAHGLAADLKTVDNQYKLAAIKSVNGRSEGRFQISLTQESALIKAFGNVLTGKAFGAVHLTESDIKTANVSIQGIKILGDAEVGSLTFKSVPFFNNTVEFVFADFELSCNCTVYASRTEIQIEVNIADSTIQIALDREQLGQESKNYKAQYTHNEICKNVTGELNLFNFLVRYAAGAPFKVYESEIIRISPQFPKVEGLQEEAARFLRHFEVLKAIERIKGIRFLDIPFNSITEASILLAQNVLDAVMGTPIIETMTGTLQFDVETVTDEVRDLLNKCKGEDGQQVDLINNSREFVTLYSHTIDIGYKRVEILNAFALEPIVESSKGTIKISSTSGQQRLTYSTDPWTS